MGHLLVHPLVRSFSCTAHSFARTAHSFACSALLALLTCSVALTCLLAHSLALGTVNNSMAIYSVFFLFWPIVRWRFDSDGHIWLLTAASCFGPLYSASEGSVLRHTAVIAFGSPLKASKKSILHCAMHNLHWHFRKTWWIHITMRCVYLPVEDAILHFLQGSVTFLNGLMWCISMNYVRHL